MWSHVVFEEGASVMKKNGLIPSAKQQKIKKWAEMIEACQKSGMQVRDWCAANQITERVYYYRHAIVMKTINQLGAEQQDVPFAEIHLDKEISDSSEGRILIRLSGAEILIPDGMSSYTIDSVLQSLRRPC